MSAGQRFEVNLDASDNIAADDDARLVSFIGDVLERDSSHATPPTEPKLKSKTGFPLHTKRPAASRFKQKQQTEDEASTTTQDRDVVMTEKEHIDRENQARLDAMSPHEIEQARQELLGSLDPALLQRLMRRADIGSGSNEAADLRQHTEQTTTTSNTAKRQRNTTKKVTFEEEEESTEQPDIVSHDSIHFPQPSQPPDLDPNSETFLEDLHSKYFPSLPSEPDKLEWMRKSSGKNTYDPTQSALNPRDIRFDFTGALLTPNAAAQIPVSAGLHHHADAPDAAGYTIPELAHLSRSTYAPQRCIAFQTLGRILYKLGKGEFGNAGEPGANTVGAEDTMGELARGLWREIETQHVIEQLVAESEGNGIDGGRHISAKAYATEAVWLWRKGGGRRWKAD